VHIVSAHNQTYTIKFSTDVNHFQEEVLADKLYDVLGVATPKFIVLSNFTQLPMAIRGVVQTAPFVRIAEFVRRVETAPRNYTAQMERHFEDTFVIDAFMANRDATKHGNYIYTAEGDFYRIDNGGSLRNRSIGKRKKGTKRSDLWDGQLIPELKTIPRYNTDLYTSVTPEMIHHQARAILSKALAMSKAFKELSTAVQIEEINREAVAQLLMDRLRMLEMLLQPGVSFPALADRPVSSLSGAGVFLICTQHNAQYVLLGNRRSAHASSDNHWVSLGGRVDFGDDQSFVHAAARELFEETTGLLSTQENSAALSTALFHDQVHEDFFYRQYFMRTSVCIDETTLSTVKPPAELEHSERVGSKEYHKFKWFPIGVIRNTTASGEISDTGERAFHAFATLLQIPRVQTILRALEANATLPAIMHAQSMPKGTGPVASEYAEFTKYEF